MTDALDTPALSGLTMGTRAVRAARAGKDLILVAGSYRTAASAADALAAATANDTVSRSASLSAVRRVLAARAGLERPRPGRADLPARRGIRGHTCGHAVRSRDR